MSESNFDNCINELMVSCLSHFSDRLNWIEDENISLESKLDFLYLFIDNIKRDEVMNPAAKLILTEMAYKRIFVFKAKFGNV